MTLLLWSLSFYWNTTLCNYANGNTMYWSDKNRLRYDFAIIRAWFYENYLVLNANKCHFLTVGLNELIPDFLFNNTTMENGIEEKILGVVINDRLNCKFHLKTICEKAYGLILRISPYSVQMLENTDQKKPRIWSLFTQPKTQCALENIKINNS